MSQKNKTKTKKHSPLTALCSLKQAERNPLGSSQRTISQLAGETGRKKKVMVSAKQEEQNGL